ncbi:MAG: class I SAM-dependent methyltransferase [Methanobacteriota archaeon]|nr:MAG: class I SAM-dependent methyltransferase [Euryarchaeota archaeon]
MTMEINDANIETLRSCPICQGNDFVLYVKSNCWRIVRCSSCLLLFVNPRPTEESIKKLFENDYIDNEERVAKDFTSWRQANLKREAKIIRSICRNGGRLLDIGTASGAFLGEFINYPEWEVEGVEPSIYAAKKAAEYYHVPVYAGFLRDQGFDSESYDVITSLDTFYFHPNPREDLAEISRILKPGGYLAIELPSLQFRLLKNTGVLCKLIYGESARLNAGVHLFYYSRKTIGMLVAQFGFKEVACYPEQSPIYGSWFARAGNYLYYWITSMLYHVSSGKIVLAPKEFIVYRKVDQ